MRNVPDSTHSAPSVKTQVRQPQHRARPAKKSCRRSNKGLGNMAMRGYTPPFVLRCLRSDIVLVSCTMMLTRILQPTCIKVPLTGTDKDSVITELVDILAENGLLGNKQAALDAVFARERTRSTGIGAGIAIPHGKSSAVKELVMALGIAQQPVDFESIDRKPVFIVILLVSPLDQTGPHIQAFAHQPTHARQ